MTREEFAAKIKEKYPQYLEVDDSVLVDKMLTKYPEYQSRISEPQGQEEPLQVAPEPTVEPSPTGAGRAERGASGRVLTQEKNKYESMLKQVTGADNVVLGAPKMLRAKLGLQKDGVGNVNAVDYLRALPNVENAFETQNGLVYVENRDGKKVAVSVNDPFSIEFGDVLGQSRTLIGTAAAMAAPSPGGKIKGAQGLQRLAAPAKAALTSTALETAALAAVDTVTGEGYEGNAAEAGGNALLDVGMTFGLEGLKKVGRVLTTGIAPTDDIVMNAIRESEESIMRGLERGDFLPRPEGQKIGLSMQAQLAPSSPEIIKMRENLEKLANNLNERFSKGEVSKEEISEIYKRTLQDDFRKIANNYREASDIEESLLKSKTRKAEAEAAAKMTEADAGKLIVDKAYRQNPSYTPDEFENVIGDIYESRKARINVSRDVVNKKYEEALSLADEFGETLDPRFAEKPLKGLYDSYKGFDWDVRLRDVNPSVVAYMKGELDKMPDLSIRDVHYIQSALGRLAGGLDPSAQKQVLDIKDRFSSKIKSIKPSPRESGSKRSPWRQQFSKLYDDATEYFEKEYLPVARNQNTSFMDLKEFEKGYVTKDQFMSQFAGSGQNVPARLKALKKSVNPAEWDRFSKLWIQDTVSRVADSGAVDIRKLNRELSNNKAQWVEVLGEKRYRNLKNSVGGFSENISGKLYTEDFTQAVLEESGFAINKKLGDSVDKHKQAKEAFGSKIVPKLEKGELNWDDVDPDHIWDFMISNPNATEKQVGALLKNMSESDKKAFGATLISNLLASHPPRSTSAANIISAQRNGYPVTHDPVAVIKEISKGGNNPKLRNKLRLVVGEDGLKALEDDLIAYSENINFQALAGPKRGGIQTASMATDALQGIPKKAMLKIRAMMGQSPKFREFLVGVNRRGHDITSPEVIRGLLMTEEFATEILPMMGDEEINVISELIGSMPTLQNPVATPGQE